MKERPILFSSSMVLALLAGTKTQTRRALKVQPLDVLPMEGDAAGRSWVGLMKLGETVAKNTGTVFRSRFGEPGDRLWVREGVRRNVLGDVRRADGYPSVAHYIADGCPATIEVWPWKNKALPGIHMPRGVCRIELEITGVRVERLNDISVKDAIAEGVQVSHHPLRPPRFLSPAPDGKKGGGWIEDPRAAYRGLWGHINGAGSWAANPFVWVVEFRRLP